MDVDLNDNGGDQSDDTNGDGEGVWSPDIEQCFREALLLFPPCGRRKHILQEEGGGKMYGRNELIARHIMMRTGKSRTRKQVSSHIQVLARRKAKAEAASASGVPVARSPSIARSQSADQNQRASSVGGGGGCYYDVWADRPIVSQKIRLVEFSAFIEYLNFQPNVTTVMPSTTNSHLINQQPIGGIVSTQDLCENMQQASLGPQQTPTLQQQHLQPYATGGQNVVQANPATTTTASTNVTHPLASNHHLPAQFNQANSYGAVGIKMENQKLLDNSQTCAISGGIGSQQQLHQMSLTSSANFTRHSYVQIDYRKTLGRQPNKLERIDISQVQDKFPEIGGSDGLFQRGPSDAFFLIKFWADLTNDYEYNIDDQNSYFGFSSHFETIHPYKDITCSTKACSYGLQVVEKVEKIYGALNSSNGRYSYDINRSPMCEFMIKFIKKLRQLPRASQMNSVLENFTVLQVITSESTSEILLCLAYVFEVDQSSGSQYHVYKLTKD